MKVRKMSKADMMRVAAEASCDPRTVASYFNGKNVRPLVQERIDAALAKMGLPGPSKRGRKSS